VRRRLDIPGDWREEDLHPLLALISAHRRERERLRVRRVRADASAARVQHGEILAFYKDRGMVPTGRGMDGDPAGRRATMFAWVYFQALERAAAGIEGF
jgi:hypothetical protein